MIKLAFEEYGDDLDEPVILIHGFFASSRNWRQIAKRLAEIFHVYVLDMRNHGLSSHHPEMDYPLMTEDLKSFMDEHDLKSANILGHSMGGKVAMWFALKHPERCKNLIVADISPVDYHHSFNHTIQALKDLPLEKVNNRKQADDFLSSSISEQSYRLFLLQNLQLVDGKYSWRIDLDIFYQTADNIVGFPALGSLKPNNKEVLFIMGGISHYTNKDAIVNYFPKAKISVLKGTNHWLHVEDPDGFVSNVIEFLKNG